MKNPSRFRVGFIVGAVAGFFGYFLQISYESTAGSVAFGEILLDAIGIAVFTGLLLGVGVSALAGRAHADATPYSDEADYGQYSKKHPPTTKVLDDSNET